MATDDQVETEVPAFLRELMPEANDDAIRQAHETIKRHLAIVLRIYERRRAERPDSPTS